MNPSFPTSLSETPWALGRCEYLAIRVQLGDIGHDAVVDIPQVTESHQVDVKSYPRGN
jgi:hypothetical protein